jgi:uncharacterized membrane protein
MNKLFAGLLGTALLASVGCHPGGTTGGPGVPGGKNPIMGTAENTFKLDTPNLSTKVKQGETKDVTIGIDRGKNFDQDVTLKFEKLPTGVTIEPAAPVIKHGDKETKVTVHAADDATLGEAKITVDGTPSKGATASNTFNLTVEKK